MKEFEMEFWRDVFLHTLRCGKPVVSAAQDADAALALFRASATAVPEKSQTRPGGFK